jgi:MFS family permease
MPRHRFLGDYRDLPRPVHVIFIAQIVNRMGDFAIPLLTLFLTRKLGYDSRLTGLLVTAAAFSSMLGTVAAGKLCDQLGRKPVLLGFQAVAALLIAACGFLPAGPAMPALLIAAGLFQGAVRPSISAMIIDLTTPTQRKAAFSLSYLGINLGVAIGPMAAGLLFEEHLAWVFWLDALTTAAALGLVALAVPETHPDRSPSAAGAEPANPGEAREDGNALAAFLRRPVLVAFSLILLLDYFMYMQGQYGLAIYTGELFGTEGARWFGLMMSCNAATVLACTLPITRLTRRLPPLACIAIGALCETVGFGMLAFRLSPALLVASTVIWTWGEILFSTNTGTWFAQHTPANLRGRFQAIQGILTQSGSILSPVLCGLVIASAGIFAAWAMIAGIGVVCTLALAAL